MPITSEFKKFIMRGNVVDLAVGMVVGATLSSIVESPIDDVITPPIGILIGGVDFPNLLITLKDGAPAPEADYAPLAAAKAVGAVTLNAGLFISAIISFLIIAAVIFVAAKLSNLLKKREVPAEGTSAESSEEILLLREIHSSLSKKQQSDGHSLNGQIQEAV